MNKYRNKITVTSDNSVHDSRKEAKRWVELSLMQKAGLIRDLQRQVSFELIPTQREASSEVYTRGEKKGLPKEGKVIEKGVTYIADFVYTDTATGEMVVEDAKGVRTKEYILKRKMLLYFHNIRIKET